MQDRRTTYLNRKQGARKKIMLGSLFVEAGLESLHPLQADVLYGMLLYCKEMMKTKPDILSTWKELGKELKSVTSKSA